jgi:hypothetical protein
MEKQKVYNVGHKMGTMLCWIFVASVASITIALTAKFIMWLF